MRELRRKIATRRGVGGDRSLRAALFPFALTRLLVFFIILVGGQINHIMTGSGSSTRDFTLSVGKLPVARLLRETVVVADINWYVGIAQNGYEKRPFEATSSHNWAFFPLFPLLWRWAAAATGELAITGMMLSNLFFFAALVFMHKTALAFGVDEATAERALFYLCIYPTSYFFSLPMTESLFLLLTVGSFYAAKRERWWLAGALGALASATRVPGVLLLPALLVLYWQTYGRAWKRTDLLGIFLVPTGLFSFMYYLYLITGNPLAFKDILKTWGRSTGFFLVTLYYYLREPLTIAYPWDFRLINFLGPVVALVCGALLLKRRQWSLGIYALSSVIVALSSLVLQSQARYAMVVFPIFFVLAEAGRNERADQTIRAVSLALLSLMAAMFAAHFSVAMA